MIIQRTVCDIHVERKEYIDATTTTTFGVDNRFNELDLCVDCENELNAMLSPYVKVGRRVRNAKVPKSKPVPSVVLAEEPVERQTSARCSCGREFSTTRGLNRHMHYPPQADAAMDHSPYQAAAA